MSFVFSIKSLIAAMSFVIAALILAPVAPAQSKSASAGNELLAQYVDPTGGLTGDDAVRIVLGNNGELAALRHELEAARALVRQARLRANPSLETNGSKQVGGPDNSLMVQGMLPLELGGRRGSRITAAEREVAVREKAAADRERLLAADVRSKLGDAIAQTMKLKLIADLLDKAVQAFELVRARVAEGRTAPLEESMSLVEVNRLRSMRETEEGRTKIIFLELRALLGMTPESVLRIREEFSDVIPPAPPLTESYTAALQNRPDLAGMRAAEELANAKVEQARSEGRLDASVTAGYQRMNFSFPLNGVTDAGELRPIQSVFHSLTFGLRLDLPVRNRNQGEVAAAIANREASESRREFAELLVRRDVAAAFARYESAVRAFEVYRVGVVDRARANLDVVRQTYELGSKTLLDYIAEERRFIEIETSFVDAAREVYQARVDVLRATAAPELITK